VSDGKTDGFQLFNSKGYVTDETARMRPMVEVNLNSIAVGKTGLGTASSPYSMAKK